MAGELPKAMPPPEAVQLGPPHVYTTAPQTVTGKG